jgi:hypothetical protein
VNNGLILSVTPYNIPRRLRQASPFKGEIIHSVKASPFEGGSLDWRSRQAGDVNTKYIPYFLPIIRINHSSKFKKNDTKRHFITSSLAFFIFFDARLLVCH